MLIFLDIDGVMVPAKGWKAPEILNDGFPAFSSKATDALRNLVSGNVTVVLTTSHKANYTIQEWKDIFSKRGIGVFNLKALPENINNLSRKEEIVNWVNLNPLSEEFIIIDDDKSLNELPGFLKENLIQTSPYIGLTDAHLENIQLLLSKNYLH
ncbi:HAD domain-containing protein [Pinibacter aurantiacus]|uniref:Uncharacterized protein n=1 Tax=Pinibacter aurantiacus TaxID=2851599 RepID=A0A9E2SAT9_9BACT|nr:HAD domain-containing protein [Pinibacter aurantiacus]MBV4357892.1 hypothetical protein [Pinibacter aurantiacus]